MNADGPGAEKPGYEKPEVTPLGGEEPLADEDLSGVAGGAACYAGEYPGTRIEPQ